MASTIKLSYGDTYINIQVDSLLSQDYEKGEIGYTTNKTWLISFYSKYTGRPMSNIPSVPLASMRDKDGNAFSDEVAFRTYWRENFYRAPSSSGSDISSPEDTAQEEYANNADAKSHGLQNGQFYRTGDAVQVVHA